MNSFFTNLNSSNSNDFMVAINACYLHLKADLLRYLLSKGAGSDAEDILQEVFLALIKRKRKTNLTLDNGVVSLKSYLYKAAIRRLGSIRNKTARTKDLHQTAPIISYSITLPFQEEDYAYLRTCITNTLNKNEQYLFYSILDEGKRQIDIAHEFEIPAVNVRVRWIRLRNRLQTNPEINRCYRDLG